jgi:hypothetical protein
LGKNVEKRGKDAESSKNSKELERNEEKYPLII